MASFSGFSYKPIPPSKDDKAAEFMGKIGTSVHRKVCWSDEDIPDGVCPDCGGDLREEQHCFMTVTVAGEGLEKFLTGSRGGFCELCPVVVLSRPSFDSIMKAGNSGVDQYEVLGIVDMDAIPEDKRDIPLGTTDDAPVPLIEFIKDTPRVSTKIGRNDLCPCGSGKKYKKCCALVTA